MYGLVRDDGCDLLALEPHLVGREHRLGVARHRRHPREVVAREELTGDDGDHAVHRGRGRRVDAPDARVRDRRAQDRHVQHARQHVVVQIVALSCGEAVVVDALHRVADAPDLGRGGGVGLTGFLHCSHADAPAVAAAAVVSAAAARMALTMFM